MPRKKAAKALPKDAGRPASADRISRLAGRCLHALRPAWVLAVAAVAYLGLVYILESAALAHGAARITHLELTVRPAKPTGQTHRTAPDSAVEFGRQQAELRLHAQLKQAIGRNPRQDALVAEVRQSLEQDPGLQTLNTIQPLFPGALKVVVTARAPELRLKATARAVDGDGVLLPIEMGHLPLPEYSRASDPSAQAQNGCLMDPLFPQAVQAVRTLIDACPALAIDPKLMIREVQVLDAGQPAELVVLLNNDTRLEWGRLNEVGDYTEMLAQRRQALLSVQARYADFSNLRVVRLYDADAPVELRQPTAVQFRRGSLGAPRLTLSTSQNR